MGKKMSKKTSLINTRFLKVVETILKTNASNELQPDSERGLSVIVGPDATAIGKIHRGVRSVTAQQISNLGIYFNLDFNYFFRNIPIKYDVYKDQIFVKQGKEELVNRMIDQFNIELTRMEQSILVFREEIDKLADEKPGSPTWKRAKAALAEGKVKLFKAFTNS